MTRTSHPAGRGGYTLLEVLLASVIALLLVAGLYVALDVTLVQMDTGRDMVTTNDLSRAVANRLTADLANTLGPLAPKSGGEAANATADGSSAADGTAGSSTTGSATTAAATTSGTGTAATASTAATAGSTTAGTAGAATGAASSTPAAATLPFGMGVVGTADSITFFTSRSPAALTDPEAAADPNAALPGDLRRVSYYLANDGSGLCRQERPWVTADGVGNAVDPDRSDEAGDVIAPEVVGFGLEYFDGGSWVGEWDGAVTDLDGVALTGPPRAVRVTLTLEFPGRNGQTARKVVTHTIPVRAAVGNYRPDAATDPTTPTTEGQ